MVTIERDKGISFSLKKKKKLEKQSHKEEHKTRGKKNGIAQHFGNRKFMNL